MNSPRKLHVLQIASGDLWAGAEVQLFTLARTLHKREDTRVSVLLMNEGELAERLRHAGIDVFVLPESQIRFPQLLIKAIALVRRICPDVIHTHRIKENLIGSVAGLLLGIPSLRTQHGAEEHPASWRAPHKVVLQKIDYYLAAYVQRYVIAVTPELAESLRRKLPTDRVRIIENGIDPENFQLADISTLDPQFQNAKRRVGIVGRLAPVKRVDIFIEMASIVAQDEKFNDVEYFIIGDGPLREELEAKATSKNNLIGKVHFLGHQSEIHSYLQYLDALVMCSDHEGLPMTLLEAMSLSVLIIGHNVGGIKLLLDNDKNGITVCEHNASKYAEAVKHTLSSSNAMATIRKSAKAHVDSKFSASGNAQNVHSLYTELAHK